MDEGLSIQHRLRENKILHLAGIEPANSTWILMRDAEGIKIRRSHDSYLVLGSKS